MARVRFRKKFSIGRVVAKLVATILALYVGGTIVNEIGDVMNCTYSPFYRGLALIGWTVSNSVVPNTAGTCNNTRFAVSGETQTLNNLITSVSGSGLLAVIGIIGIASIVMEFVEFRMK